VRRRLLFALLAVAMILAALLIGLRHRPPRSATTPIPGTSTPAARTLAPVSSAPGLRRSARAFLEAFLAYEGGKVDRATRTAIRRQAGHLFATELLGAWHPHTAGPAGAEPTITAIRLVRLVRLSHRRDLALLTGTARRSDGPEPFAFLLARRGGRWLVIAPAE
jgi:hypothetical protein